MWTHSVSRLTAYSIAYTVYPVDPVGAMDGNPELVLDGARNGAAKNVGGTVSSEKRVTVGKYRGRDISIVIADKSVTVWLRMVSAQNRLYTLQAILPSHPTRDPEVTRFFESFKLTL